MSYSIQYSGDGAINVTGTATVTVVYGDRSTCPENKIACMNSYPNKFKDCFGPMLFYPEKRKYIPQSLKGTAAILPAITVCRQNYYLPKQ